MTTSRSNLWAKLHKLQKELVFFKNTESGPQYKYTPAEAAFAKARSAMDDLGLLLIPAIRDGRFTERTTSRGKQEVISELLMKLTWVDVESGEELEVDWYAQGVDFGEKGVGKALTYGLKYYIFTEFLIPRGDDPDRYQVSEKTENGRSGSAQISEKKLAELTAIRMRMQALARHDLVSTEQAEYLTNEMWKCSATKGRQIIARVENAIKEASDE